MASRVIINKTVFYVAQSEIGRTEAGIIAAARSGGGMARICTTVGVNLRVLVTPASTVLIEQMPLQREEDPSSNCEPLDFDDYAT